MGLERFEAASEQGPSTKKQLVDLRDEIIAGTSKEQLDDLWLMPYVETLFDSSYKREIKDSLDSIFASGGKISMVGKDAQGNTKTHICDFDDQGGFNSLSLLQVSGRSISSKSFDLDGVQVKLTLTNKGGGIYPTLHKLSQPSSLQPTSIENNEIQQPSTIDWFTDLLETSQENLLFFESDPKKRRIWGVDTAPMEYIGTQSLDDKQKDLLDEWYLGRYKHVGANGKRVNYIVIKNKNNNRLDTNDFVIDFDDQQNFVRDGDSWTVTTKPISQTLGGYTGPIKLKITLKKGTYPGTMQQGDVLHAQLLQLPQVTGIIDGLTPSKKDSIDIKNYAGITRMDQKAIITENDSLPKLNLDKNDFWYVIGYGTDIHTSNTLTQGLTKDQIKFLESLYINSDEHLGPKDDKQKIAIYEKSWSSVLPVFVIDLDEAVKVGDHWEYTGKDRKNDESWTVRIDAKEHEYTDSISGQVMGITLLNVGPSFGLDDDWTKMIKIPTIELPENPFTQEKKLENEHVNLGGEIPTYYDKKVYPLGKTQMSQLKDLYIHDGGKSGDITLRLDSRNDGDGAFGAHLHFDPIILNVNPNSLTKQGDIYVGTAQGTVKGVVDTWKYSLQVDEVTKKSTVENILRVSIDPPDSFIAMLKPSQSLDKDLESLQGKLFYPVDKRYSTITGAFHEPRGTSGGKSRLHAGIDIDVPQQKVTVYSVYDGRVLQVGYDRDGYGTYVDIVHSTPNGAMFTTRYAHLNKASLTVKAKDTVDKGQPFGLTENDPKLWGNAQGTHLHLEVHNSAGVPQDPLPYLDLP